jgi:hypothetical protein
MVNILLEQAPLDDCEAADANGDGQVTVDEIILAVNYALEQCPQSVPLRRVTQVGSPP